ncbi:Uncharacterised protein [Vibrio cholerae]|nr:Uncharacterised protein [Vibrio cholerae]
MRSGDTCTCCALCAIRSSADAGVADVASDFFPSAPLFCTSCRLERS